MKGKSALFSNTKGSGISVQDYNKISYDLKNNIHPHKLPIRNVPNSTITQKDDAGNVVRIRHYNDKGVAYKDVDYTDHNRPDTHKNPHTHIIDVGIIIDRKKGARSYENR